MFAMTFWAAAQIQPQRDKVALHWLGLYGFETYAPRLCDRRVVRGSKVVKTPLLFPGYVFVVVELQWSQAKFSPGVVRIVMDGATPAAVPDAVITSLKRREVDGLIELPKPPKFRRGDHVQIRRGPFADRVGLFVGMRPRDRVAVLLSMLGTSRRVELPDADVARWP
jgi:transcriptional antiterminator RfaH